MATKHLLFCSLILVHSLGCETQPIAMQHVDSKEVAPESSGQLDTSDANESTHSDESGVKDDPKAEVKPSQETTPTKAKPKVSIDFNPLTDLEKYVILEKGTERAFVGQYTDTEAAGTYICRQCNAPLYDSTSKFHSGCGWPSFDDEIEGAVERHPDIDGMRVEIVCKNCLGHLGHVFEGEGFTEKDTRHCVNSVSMKFIPKGKPLPEVISKQKAPENAEESKED